MAGRNDRNSVFHLVEFFPLFCYFHLLNVVYCIGYQLFKAVSPIKIFFPLFFLSGLFGFLFGLFGHLFLIFDFQFLPG